MPSIIIAGRETPTSNSSVAHSRANILLVLKKYIFHSSLFDKILFSCTGKWGQMLFLFMKQQEDIPEWNLFHFLVSSFSPPRFISFVAFFQPIVVQKYIAGFPMKFF